MKRKILAVIMYFNLLSFCFTFFNVYNIYATIYYVDFDSGSDINDGLSQASAWKNIPGTRTRDDSAYISPNNWNRIYAGDLIKIKSGTTHDYLDGGRILINNIYYDNGSSSNKISIQRDTSWGNGQVTIDGNLINIPPWIGLIQVTDRSYIIIDGAVANGMLIRNSSVYGVGIYSSGGSDLFVILKNVEAALNSSNQIMIDNADEITIDTVKVHDQIGGGAGIYCWNADSPTVKNSIAYNIGSGSGNQDGIMFNGCTNFLGQDLIAYNNGGAGYGSGLDSSSNGSCNSAYGTWERVVAYNNANTQLSGSSNCSGDSVKIINSFFWGTNKWANVVAYEGISMIVYNSTFGDGRVGYPAMLITNNAAATVENTIFYGTFSTPMQDSSSGSYTQSNNYLSDPLFVASVPLPDVNYFKLQSSSPCIDVGKNLSIEGFTNDYDLINRPHNAAWDIGAFEFVSDTIPTVLPNPPSVLRIVY